ncbi:hypothetical protein ABZV81_17680 [Streptomyces parvus]|uniref:hypothetical protein n=1 Tax=Streptomyces parvus TaxID=66428 RepID=UPI0033AC05CB
MVAALGPVLLETARNVRLPVLGDGSGESTVALRKSARPPKAGEVNRRVRAVPFGVSGLRSSRTSVLGTM